MFKGKQCISYPDFINIIGVLHGLAEVAVSGRSGAQEQLEAKTHCSLLLLWLSDHRKVNGHKRLICHSLFLMLWENIICTFMSLQSIFCLFVLHARVQLVKQATDCLCKKSNMSQFFIEPVILCQTSVTCLRSVCGTILHMLGWNHCCFFSHSEHFKHE